MEYLTFHPAHPMPEYVFEDFGARVPPEIVQTWRDFGQGFIGENGYLRVVDPSWLWEFFPATVTMSDELVPLFVTAFGDIIVYHEGYLEGVFYRHGALRQVFPYDADLLPRLLEDPGFLRSKLFYSNYWPAIERLGAVPSTAECLGYVPLLSLGGREEPESLQRVALREHILLMTQVQGPVRTFTTAEIEAGEDH